MKSIKTPTLLMMLAITTACASNAYAALINIEEAYEADISDVSLPKNTSGEVSIRQCVDFDCETTRLDVDENTTYHLGLRSPATTLEDLRQAARPEGQAVYVFYRADDETVTRVVLSAQGGGAVDGNNDEDSDGRE